MRVGDGGDTRGTVGPSSLLAQRAASEGPRWTRAVEDNPTIPREGCANPSGGGERVGRGNGCGTGLVLAEPPR